MNRALLVRIREPRNPLRELEVCPGATIGRAADNDVVVADSSVSRHHARIEQKDRRWVIRDLGSRSGTGLPGQILKRDEEAPILSGMRLRLGDTDLEFLQSSEPHAVRPPRSKDATAVSDATGAGRPVYPQAPLLATKAPQPRGAAEGETARASGLEFRILVIDGKDRRLVVGRTPMLIGRARRAELRLRNETVSAVHALLDRDGERLVLADQGSTNGTWLGQERIAPHAAVPLASPCALRLGEVEVWVTTAVPAPRGSETRAVRALLGAKVLGRADVRAALRRRSDNMSRGEALLLATGLTVSQWTTALRNARPSLLPVVLGAIALLGLLIAAIVWFV